MKLGFNASVEAGLKKSKLLEREIGDGFAYSPVLQYL